jgi:hypothetical protein
MGPALLAPTIRTVGESGRRRFQGNEPPAALASLAARRRAHGATMSAPTFRRRL